MKNVVVLSVLVAYAAAAVTDPFNDFMQQLEIMVKKTNFGSCKNISIDQSSSKDPPSGQDSISFGDCIQYSNQMTEGLMHEFRPIALQVIANASSNVNGDYYEFDKVSGSWHLPNQSTPEVPVNGLYQNAKIMTIILDSQFKRLVQTKSDNTNILQKRGINNVKALPGYFSDELSSLGSSIPSISSASKSSVNPVERQALLEEWTRRHVKLASEKANSLYEMNSEGSSGSSFRSASSASKSSVNALERHASKERLQRQAILDKFNLNHLENQAKLSQDEHFLQQKSSQNGDIESANGQTSGYRKGITIESKITKIHASLLAMSTIFSLVAVILLIVQSQKIGLLKSGISTLLHSPTPTMEILYGDEMVSQTEIPTSIESSSNLQASPSETTSSVSESNTTVISESNTASQTTTVSDNNMASETSSSASQTPSVIFDQATNTTYFFDDNTGFYYYWNPEKNSYEWYTE